MQMSLNSAKFRCCISPYQAEEAPPSPTIIKKDDVSKVDISDLGIQVPL